MKTKPVIDFLRRAPSSIDRIFARGMMSQILAFGSLVVFVWVGTWGILWLCDASFVGEDFSQGPFEFLNVYYVLINGMDMNPTLSLFVQIFMIFLSLVGFVIFSGGLIAVLSNMVARRVELFQKGLVHYSHRDHFLIFGCGEAVHGLIESIHSGLVGTLFQGAKYGSVAYEGEDIVLVTQDDVEKIRERVLSAINFEKSSWRYRNRIFFYSADTESEKQLAKFYPERAKGIFILGDSGILSGRDVRNLSCMGTLSETVTERLARMPYPRQRPVPVFVEIDRPETFSILQKVDRIPVEKGNKIYLHPFNLHENCARQMWGLYSVSSPSTVAPYRPLDYVPISPDSEKYVHLVIIGLSSAGTALLLEALRICHYANFETKNLKTKITIVDRDLNSKKEAFLARFPNLDQICDIDLEFRAENAESAGTRCLLVELAKNPNCLLTVAVCLNDPESALSVGLTFPEAVYCYENPGKPYGNSVLVRQTALGELANSVDGENTRYRYVKIFGKLGEDFDAELLSDKIPMRIHYDYATFDYQNGSPLSDPIAEPTAEANIAEMEKFWSDLPEYKRWANRFQAEMFRTYLRTLGFDVWRASETSRDMIARVRRRIRENREVLMRMEHRRWCAEKTLGGFVAGPVKDEVRRIHPDLCPFEALTQEKKNLDFRPILNLAYLLADEHWQIYELPDAF